MSDNITILKIIGYGIVALAIIIGIWFVINYPIAEAQTNTTVPKAVTSPPNPTPTTPNPNFQYLPQKAYVLPFAPENGVPDTPSLATPLSPVPQLQTVQPVPTQQAVPVQNSTNIIDQLGGIGGITAMLGAAGVYFKTRILDKKTDKVEATTKENSTMIVKGAKVDKTLADQVYDNMPDKGESIHDKPEIKLDNLNKNIDEATETTAKA